MTMHFRILRSVGDLALVLSLCLSACNNEPDTRAGRKLSVTERREIEALSAAVDREQPPFVAAPTLDHSSGGAKPVGPSPEGFTRFQAPSHVLVGRRLDNGNASTACVTSGDSARSFFASDPSQPGVER